MLDLELVFDADFYHKKYSEEHFGVTKSDFLAEGKNKGLTPTPIFDPSYYFAQLSDEEKAKIHHGYTVFDHFCEFAVSLQINPSPFFDIEYYANQANVPKSLALLHYFKTGKDKKIDPSPYFSVSFYISSLNESERNELGDKLSNALGHFIIIGEGKGLSPSPIINVKYYADSVGIEENKAVRHFIFEGLYEGKNPSPIFDVDYYVEAVGITRAEAIKHFFHTGLIQGLNPSPFFDLQFYAANPENKLSARDNVHAFYDCAFKLISEEVLLKNCTPFVSQVESEDIRDFLRSEKPVFTGLFDESFYCSQLTPDIIREIETTYVSPFRYFVLKGLSQIISPSPYIDITFCAQKYNLPQEEVLKHLFGKGVPFQSSNALFDPDYCTKNNSDINSMLNFIAWAMNGTGNPGCSLYFDRNFYCESANVSPQNAVQHFLCEGRYEAINPSIYIDIRFYSARQNIPCEQVLNHYVLNQTQENYLKPAPFYDPYFISHSNSVAKLYSPFFNVEFYKVNLKQRNQEDAQALYRHFITQGLEDGINPSPLFDPIYYASRYGISLDKAVKHFFTIGMYEGKDPSPFFNTSFYVKQLTAEEKRRVDTGKITPLEHYIFEGEAKNYLPCPVFDPEYCLSNEATQKGAVQNGITALEYYMWKQQADTTIQTSPFFEAEYYSNSNGVSKDVALRHFLIEGMSEGLCFSPFFDIAHYVKLSKVDRSDALAHFLLDGFQKKISPLALFDMDYYEKQLNENSKKLNLFRHYLMLSKTSVLRSPSPFFDIEYYLEKSNLQKYQFATSKDLLEDFLIRGDTLGLIPTPYFDEFFYRQELTSDQLNEIKKEGISFFSHFLFLLYDEIKPISLNPFFDIDFYAATANVPANQAIRKFFIEGDLSKDSPSPLFDSTYYINQLTILAEQGAVANRLPKNAIIEAKLNPYLYFLRYQNREGVNPSIYFDTDYYCKRWKSKLVGTVDSTNAARHFLIEGVRLGLDPSPYVDLTYYTHFTGISNREVLRHFLLKGKAAGLNPSPFFGPDLNLLAYFDKDFYQKQSPSLSIITANSTPEEYVKHFILDGEKSGRCPSPFFDPVFYALGANIPRENTFRHYLIEGRAKNIKPSPFFDDVYYASTLSKEIVSTNTAGQKTLLLYFLTDAKPKPVSLSPYFDNEYYLSTYNIKIPELPGEASDEAKAKRVVAQVVAQVSDFLLKEENKNPNPFFDIVYYQERYKSEIELKFGKGSARSRALDHYILYGYAQNLVPSVYFDPAYYLTQLDTQQQQYLRENRLSPLWFFITRGQSLLFVPTPYFDGHFYTERYNQLISEPAERLDSSRNQYRHYLMVGQKIGMDKGQQVPLDPSPFFDVRYYSKKYSVTGQSAFEYFLKEGVNKAHIPTPFFDADFYEQEFKRLNPTEAITTNYFRHFLTSDKAVNPFPFFDMYYYANEIGFTNASILILLKHYIVEGQKTEVDPSPFFDTAFYKTATQWQSTATSTPMRHFLDTGEAAGVNPTPYFDPIFYANKLKQKGRQNTRSLIRDFLIYGEGAGISATPFFDVDYFCRSKNMTSFKLAGISVSPLRYFLSYGVDRGDVPSVFFDERFYLKQLLKKGFTLDVSAESAFHHFMVCTMGLDKRSALQNCSSMPLFDVDYYAQQKKIDITKVSAIRNFVLSLSSTEEEWHSPSPFFNADFYIYQIADKDQQSQFRANKNLAFLDYVKRFLTGVSTELSLSPAPFINFGNRKPGQLARNFVNKEANQDSVPNVISDFDKDYYLTEAGLSLDATENISQGKISAIRYYLTQETKTPFPLVFDEDFYQQLLVSQKDEHYSQDLPLLWHYLIWGKQKGYQTAPNNKRNSSGIVFEQDQVDKILSAADKKNESDEMAINRLNKIKDLAVVEFEGPTEKLMLLQDNITSAIRVVSQSSATFCKKYSNCFKGADANSKETSAKRFFNKAKEVVAQTQLEYLTKTQSNSPLVKNLAFGSRPSTHKTPSYPDVFGKLDYFNTDNATTLHSPAAYFYDLFRVVTSDDLLVRTTSADENSFKPWLSLSNRRPDLYETPLDNKHTFEEVAYLEIVNNVLVRQYLALAHLKAMGLSILGQDFTETKISGLFSEASGVEELATRANYAFKEKNKQYAQLAFEKIANDNKLYFSPPAQLEDEKIESYFSALDLSSFDVFSALSMQDDECIFMNAESPMIKYQIALRYLKLSAMEIKWLDSFFDLDSEQDRLSIYQTDYQSFLDSTKLSRKELAVLIPYQADYKPDDLSFYQSLYINRHASHIVFLSIDGNKKTESINNLTHEKLHRIAFLNFLSKKLSISYLDLDVLLDAVGIDKSIAPTQIVMMAKIMWLHRKSNVPLEKICQFFRGAPEKTLNMIYQKLKLDKNPMPANFMVTKVSQIFTPEANHLQADLTAYKSIISVIGRFAETSMVNINMTLAILNSRGILKLIDSDATLVQVLFSVVNLTRLCGVEALVDLIKLDLFASSHNELSIENMRMMCGLAQTSDTLDYLLKLYSTSMLLKSNNLSIDVMLSSSLGIYDQAVKDKLNTKAKEFLTGLFKNLAALIQDAPDPDGVSDQDKNELVCQQLASHLGLSHQVAKVMYVSSKLSTVGYNFVFPKPEDQPEKNDQKNIEVMLVLYRITDFVLATNIIFGNPDLDVSDLNLFMECVVSNLKHHQGRKNHNYITPCLIKASDVRQVFRLKTLQQSFKTTENDFLKWFKNLNDDKNKASLLALTEWGSDAALLTSLDLKSTSYESAFDNMRKCTIPMLDVQSSSSLSYAETILPLLKLSRLFSVLQQLNGNMHVLESAKNYLSALCTAKETALLIDPRNELILSLEHTLKAKDKSAYDKACREFAERARDVLLEKVLHFYADNLFKLFNITKISDLSEYLLLDLEMSKDFSTSYVVQGTASLQWYLQRCRLGLEQGITSNIPDSWWTWIQMYRVWEANRKVLLYPESYIEPDLRTEQSPEFKEFIQGTMQSSLDKEAILNNYQEFFHKVVLLSKLKVIDACSVEASPEQARSSDFRNTYFLARTSTIPYIYYYCTGNASTDNNNVASIAELNFWQKVSFQINAPTATIMYCYQRPFIFWNEIKYKNIQVKDKFGNKVINKNVSCKSQYSYLTVSNSWHTPQIIYEGDINLDDAVKQNQVRIDKKVIRATFEDPVSSETCKANYELSVRNTLRVGEFLREGESLFLPAKKQDTNQDGYLAFQLASSSVAMLFAPLDANSSYTVYGQTSYDSSTNLLSLGGNSTSVNSNSIRNSNYAPALVMHNLKYYLFFQDVNNNLQLSSSTSLTSGWSTKQIAGWQTNNGICAIHDKKDNKICISFRGTDNQFYIFTLNNESSPSDSLSWGRIFQDDWAQRYRPMIVEKENDRLYLFSVEDNNEIVIKSNPNALDCDPSNWNRNWNTCRTSSFTATAVSAVRFDDTFIYAYADKDTHDLHVKNWPERESNNLDIIKGKTHHDIGLAVSSNGEYLYLAFADESGIIQLYYSSKSDFKSNTNTSFKAYSVGPYLSYTGVNIFTEEGKNNQVSLIYGNDQGQIYVPTCDISELQTDDATPHTIVSTHVATLLEDGSFCILKSGYKGSNRSDYQSDDFFYDYSTSTGRKGYSIPDSNLFLELQNNGVLQLKGKNISNAYSFFHKQLQDSTANSDINTINRDIEAVSTFDLSFARPWIAYDEKIGIFFTPYEKFDETLSNYVKPSNLNVMYLIDPKLDISLYTESKIQTEDDSNRIFADILFEKLKAIPGEKWYVEYLKNGFKSAIEDCSTAYNQLQVFKSYAWEVFFHAPFFIANYLHNQQMFLDARDWYHKIYNPLQNKTCFSFPEFSLSTGDRSGTQYPMSSFNDVIAIYHEHNFEPHRIAKLRPIAYQKAVVMYYIQNLIDWADYLFTQDCRETITQATAMYMLANDLLGPRPQGLGTTRAPNLSLTFDNFLIGSIPLDPTVEWLLNQIENTIDLGSGQPSASLEHQEFPMFFSIPENKEFIKFWDKVDDRLFKIRHCQNINGVRQELSLFSPEIDPRALVRAAAMGGINLSEFLPSAVPIYRFRVLLEQTRGFIAQVTQLGNTLLSAVERLENEKFQTISMNNQSQLLDVVSRMREIQVDQADHQVEQTKSNLETAEHRRKYLNQLIQDGYLAEETAAFALRGASQGFYAASSVLEILAGTLGVSVPDEFTGAVGLSLVEVTTIPGGNKIAGSLHSWSSATRLGGDILNYLSEDLNLVATNKRREKEWQQQLVEAESNCDSLTRQVQIAQMQADIARRDYESHQLQIKQQADLIQYYQSKFTNVDLYRWMVDQLQMYYKQAFDLALATAKKAERAYQFEVNKPEKRFFSNNYYTFFRKGLLAGEGLMLDLNRLEQAYSDDNRRLFEVQKVISLKDLFAKRSSNNADDSNVGAGGRPAKNKFELFIDAVKSQQGGGGNNDVGSNAAKTLTIEFGEEDFKELPLVNRRVKRVSISIPGLAKPYQNTYFILSHISNGDQKDNDPVFRLSGDQVILSSSVNDPGLFSAPLQDVRYLPFEGTNVFSKWELKFCGDPTVITNIIFQLEYTAEMQNSLSASNSMRNSNH